MNLARTVRQQGLGEAKTDANVASLAAFSDVGWEFYGDEYQSRLFVYLDTRTKPELA